MRGLLLRFLTCHLIATYYVSVVIPHSALYTPNSDPWSPHPSDSKCLVSCQFAWLSPSAELLASCGPTKNAHLYRNFSQGFRWFLQLTGLSMIQELTWSPHALNIKLAAISHYYSRTIKIYRPIVSWQWLLWNSVWIMKHWLLLNSILMGVANSWANTIRVIRASPVHDGKKRVWEAFILST